MTRQDGEVFEWEGKRYKVVVCEKGVPCRFCSFADVNCMSIKKERGECWSPTTNGYIYFVEIEDESLIKNTEKEHTAQELIHNIEKLCEAYTNNTGLEITSICIDKYASSPTSVRYSVEISSKVRRS